jgi:hypothetical protein
MKSYELRDGLPHHMRTIQEGFFAEFEFFVTGKDLSVAAVLAICL